MVEHGSWPTSSQKTRPNRSTVSRHRSISSSVLLFKSKPPPPPPLVASSLLSFIWSLARSLRKLRSKPRKIWYLFVSMDSFLLLFLVVVLASAPVTMATASSPSVVAAFTGVALCFLLRPVAVRFSNKLAASGSFPAANSCCLDDAVAVVLPVAGEVDVLAECWTSVPVSFAVRGLVVADLDTWCLDLDTLGADDWRLATAAILLALCCSTLTSAAILSAAAAAAVDLSTRHGMSASCGGGRSRSCSTIMKRR